MYHMIFKPMIILAQKIMTFDGHLLGYFQKYHDNTKMNIFVFLSLSVFSFFYIYFPNVDDKLSSRPSMIYSLIRFLQH